MKKIYLLITVLFLITGCDVLMNNPTKRVEKFLDSYKTLNSVVMTQLDNTLESNNMLTKEQKSDYKDLMKKQYQNLSYEIKKETVDGNSAAVEVEIEVYDYSKAIEEAEKYLANNQSEFLNNGNIDEKKYKDYEINHIKNVKNRIKYTLTLTLTKKDGNWELDDITEIERQKIHGLYAT
jgi:hypothetical protein